MLVFALNFAPSMHLIIIIKSYSAFNQFNYLAFFRKLFDMSALFSLLITLAQIVYILSHSSYIILNSEISPFPANNVKCLPFKLLY